MKVLSQHEVEQFITRGHVALRDAFPREVAAECRAFLWKELGLSPDDRAAWKKNVVHVQKVFTSEPFTGAFTKRLFDAIDDVMGEGRWVPPGGLGWWPVAFPGFEPPPWKPPTGGWHVDGIQFHHRLTSRDQGLLPLFVLSDIGPGDGGTAFDEGSHRVAARILAAAEPAGLDVNELAKRVTATPRLNVVEGTGRAGDVILLHPFMLHARSPNTGNSVRFICNPCIQYKEAMRLDGPALSPVERAIKEAVA